jgi:uncharacterized membrane protein YgdD (TMEM256/DUF423 family)
MKLHNYFLAAGLLGALAVVFGALGAHALEKILNPEMLTSFKTGVQYHILHSIVLLVITFNAQKIKRFKLIYSLFTVGILFFSFSIYALSFGSTLQNNIFKTLWPITPIGGTLLIVAWILTAFSYQGKS